MFMAWHADDFETALRAYDRGRLSSDPQESSRHFGVAQGYLDRVDTNGPYQDEITYLKTEIQRRLEEIAQFVTAPARP